MLFPGISDSVLRQQARNRILNQTALDPNTAPELLMSFSEPLFDVQSRLDLAKWTYMPRDLTTSGEFIMGLEGEKENNTVEVYDRRVVKEVYGHTDTDLPGKRIFLGEGDLMEGDAGVDCQVHC